MLFMLSFSVESSHGPSNAKKDQESCFVKFGEMYQSHGLHWTPESKKLKIVMLVQKLLAFLYQILYQIFPIFWFYILPYF